MAATNTPPSNRHKLTPSNSPFARPSRCHLRGRPAQDSRLSLRRVVGTTCRSPTGFDTVNSLFAYTAGAAVVVIDVHDDDYSQRFFRARPSAQPLCSVASLQNAPSTPMLGAPKANDSRNRVAPSLRDAQHSPADWADSPGSRTWTSRERIKAATCISLSRDGRFLAVGETGYAPRVLIFNLHDGSSDTPLVSISEHAFGVQAVSWSADSKYLASIGAANDGFLYVWKIDSRTGAAKLFQQNKCTSSVKGMVWMGNTLITLGVRHVKAWRIEDSPLPSPTKLRLMGESASTALTAQKPLPGRNMLLGDMLEATFSCAAVCDKKLIICTDTGDVCILLEDEKQMKVVKVLGLNFSVSTITIRDRLAYVGGKDGHFATLDVARVINNCTDSVKTSTDAALAVVALGFLTDKLVTIDSKQSIDLWKPHQVPGLQAEAVIQIPLPGNGEPIAGVHALQRPNKLDAAFVTWSFSGKFTFWDMDGLVRSSVQIHIDTAEPDADWELANQLTCARTTSSGDYIITADRLGILKVTETDTNQCVLDTKAHSSDCMCICLFEQDSKFLMACSGRDRTAQLFHRSLHGNIEHFQTLEFAARVVQVLIPTDDKVITCSLDRTLQIYDLVTKEGDLDCLAALASKAISLRASPTSMAISHDKKSIYVSLLDKSVCQFDLTSGRQMCAFKCIDEGSTESAVLESLSVGQWACRDVDYLLGLSNTDKSIRLYDASSGAFLDREWGHTEAINGVCLIEDEDGSRKVVSVGSDGTIMLWALELSDPWQRTSSRDPSPVKEASAGRQTLRKVLSKAEIAEFQRPTTSAGRLNRRSSRLNLTVNCTNPRTPNGTMQTSSYGSTVSESTPSKRPASNESLENSPPSSPKAGDSRRPSLLNLGKSVRKKTSSTNLRAFGSLNMATEQTCRALRAYRKKLTSSDPISKDALTELDNEMRLTASALGDRATRSEVMNETVLSGLLDQYSERLVALLDEKLRLGVPPKAREEETMSEEPGRDLTDASSSASSP
ncbi:hypothetical protein CDD81_4084 [Ophiocordyceps australis]|uniref:Uncharacterized protein n=1 Tax=Ophiocordyceps australis TaxID=1399860 RepID=A0A2C5XW45_9HYPO|nr:hypothetical protein CDD81_4084 [Ophiocordyceps australis]